MTRVTDSAPAGAPSVSALGPAPAPPPQRRPWWPHPVLSAAVGLAWCALVGSVAPVHLLSAALLGWAVPRLVGGLLVPAPGRIRWRLALGLLLRVLWDVAVCNVVVARQVLGRVDRLQPAWVAVPLATAHPHVNALLAAIITTTPGTVSCVVDEAQALIWVHVLHTTDPAAVVADIQARYEAPLIAVFGAARRPAPADAAQTLGGVQ